MKHFKMLLLINIIISVGAISTLFLIEPNDIITLNSTSENFYQIRYPNDITPYFIFNNDMMVDKNNNHILTMDAQVFWLDNQGIRRVYGNPNNVTNKIILIDINSFNK